MKNFLGNIKLILQHNASSPARELSKEVLQFLEGLTVVSVLSAVAQKTSGGTFYILAGLGLIGMLALFVWCGSTVLRLYPKIEGESHIVQRHPAHSGVLDSGAFRPPQGLTFRDNRLGSYALRFALRKRAAAHKV